MQTKNSNKKNIANYLTKFDKISDKRFYFGSMVFISGIILCLVGLFFLVAYKINITFNISNNVRVAIAIGSIGIGLPLVLSGVAINFSPKRNYTYLTILFGIVLSWISTIFGVNAYLMNKWYHPLIGKVAIGYGFGILLLAGTSFAALVMYVIASKTTVHKTEELIKKTKFLRKVYTDEEINRDIEEALSTSKYTWGVPSKIPDLIIKSTDESDLTLSKAMFGRAGKITRVSADSINNGVKSLSDLRGGRGKTESSKSDAQDLNKAAEMLRKAREKQEKEKEIIKEKKSIKEWIKNILKKVKIKL